VSGSLRENLKIDNKPMKMLYNEAKSKAKKKAGREEQEEKVK
jgi:hypothetical protein